MNRMILCAASIAAMCSVISCSQKEIPSVEGSRTGFALSFFKEVNKTVSRGENVVASPYSAGVALSMLAEGAEDDTRFEIENALNGCQFRQDTLDGGEYITIKSANSMWVDEGFSVRNRYSSLLQKEYDAMVAARPFADRSTVMEINGWCSENTEGKINEIVGELPRGTVMVLLNALYFNAPWEDEFDPSATSSDYFHGQSSDCLVDMMYRKGRYNYAEFQGAQIIELPYKASRYSMFVALPPAGMDVDAFLPYISESLYTQAVGMMSPVEVRFRMPKVKLETEMVLNRTLQNMGVRTAFSAAADLSGISSMGPLSVSEVRQKCYIDIAEAGTEAAAVTSVMVRLTSVRPESDVKEMTVNRPYVFFIADRNNHDILFAGKIVNM